MCARSPDWRAGIRVAVIDGDIAHESIDADRDQGRRDATAVQINTGGECHLDAVMLQSALDTLHLDSVELLIVENVGNLICPASFKLGTHTSVLIATVPEGDDKPYKYPGMYRGVDALVINKDRSLALCGIRHGVLPAWGGDPQSGTGDVPYFLSNR